MAINNSAGMQIEGICCNRDYYFLSNETSSIVFASLFKVNLSELITDLSSIDKKKYIFYSSDNKLNFVSESGETQVYITDVKLHYTSIEKFFIVY